MGVLTWAPAAFRCIGFGYDVFANLDGATISTPPADWAGITDYRPGLVKGRKLPGVNLRSANGVRAVFVNANLMKANLQRAQLSGADLRGAFLLKADLQGANLGIASLQKAYLFKANLREADLRGANLAGADLRGANLSEATGLTQEQVDKACGDDKTQLPGKLTIPLCTEVSK